MLDRKTTSLSLAITFEILYLLCALFVYLFPTGSLLFFNTWFHGIDLVKIASPRPIVFVDFLIGFAGIFLFAYLAGTIFTALYNAIYKKSNKQ